MRASGAWLWSALNGAALSCAVLLSGCGDDGADAGPRVDGAVDGSVADGSMRDAGDGGGTDTGPPPPACDGSPPSGDGEVGGALVTWQPLSITLTGPASDEGASDPNPFLDFRLTVTFTAASGATTVVPGFFDGDGDGGGTGNRWRARFSPDEPGEHTWVASFRSGPEVAVDLDPAAGSAASPDGAAGSFCVENPDPTAPGFLALGRLRYADAHYLRFSDGSWWIKGGADSPENFLGYAGFDNTVDQPGGAGTDGLMDGVHRYGPHVSDWRDGDPDWGDGAGRGIIGALNYLATEEVNSIYFLPCNLGGDGRETYPYVSVTDLLHFDLSKLHQWEMVFAHAQRSGIALHVVLNETETENENLHDGGTLGTERKLYYRELVARLGHHNALFWNIGEENDYGRDRQLEFARYIDALDPYDHPTTVHTHVNRPADQYSGLVGEDAFDMTSIQLDPARAGEFTEEWRRQSAAAGRPWAVMLDEISPAGTGVTDTNAPEIRRQTLWPALLSGAGGVEWYFGYHALPLGGDMRTEDFRTRSEMWRYTRIALHFMHDHLPFHEMEPDDGLLSGASGPAHVFKKRGEIYAVYLSDAGGAPELDLSGDATGTFTVRWFDPRAGTFAGAETTVTASAATPLGSPPSDPAEDWVVLLTGGGAPPPPPDLRVERFVLVNADTDADIGPLGDGDTIDLGAVGSNLNVRAETVPATVGSVRFGLDGMADFRTESEAPYALGGDTAGDYAPWTPAPGSHRLTATPYEGSGATGMAGTALSVGFTVAP